jgi:hypothetical protein
MSNSSILSDSFSICEDAIESFENRMINDYTDISYLNKKYMCLWNDWVEK